VNTTRKNEQLFNDIRYFIPSWFKLNRRKALTLQAINFIQAASIAILAWSLVGPLNHAFDTYASSVFYMRMVGAHGIATAIFFKVLPQAIWRTGIAASLFWWLGQQKKLLQP
jgi:hypothetical protein